MHSAVSSYRARACAPPRGLGRLAPRRAGSGVWRPARLCSARRAACHGVATSAVGFSCALPRPSRPGAAASWRRAGAQGSAGGPAPRRPGIRATAGRPRRPSPSRFPPSLPHFARMHSEDPHPAARPLRPLHNALAGPRMRRDECHARCRRACAHSPRPGHPPRPCRLRHARAPSARRRARGSGPRPRRPAPLSSCCRHALPRPRAAAPPACMLPPAMPRRSRAKRGRRFAAKEAIAWRAAAGGGAP